jgi:hypothetical protein
MKRKVDAAIEEKADQALPALIHCCSSQHSGPRSEEANRGRHSRFAPMKSAIVNSRGACVVSPGVDFKWHAILGDDKTVAEEIPHTCYAGPQTIALRRQIEAMREGGRVILVASPNPFKCPPDP